MEQLADNDRALSLDEALSIAILLQQNEQWAAAADIYRSILDVGARLCRCVALLRSARASAGRSDEAVALIERSLELEPDRADWYSNLGIVLQDRLQLDDAIVAYRRAIALDPDHANAHNNLGVVLRAKDKPVEAEAAYRAAIRIESRALGRVQQPRRPAERPEAVARSGRLLLEGHHVEAERSRSAQTAGDRALHAR